MAANVIKIQVTDLPVHKVWEPCPYTKEYSVMDYCRKLREEGYSDETVVESYRGEQLSLRMSVGWGSEHTILENRKEGPKIIKYQPFPENMKRQPSTA